MVLGGGAVSYERGNPVDLCAELGSQDAVHSQPASELQHLEREREFFIDNLLDRIHFIIVIISTWK